VGQQIRHVGSIHGVNHGGYADPGHDVPDDPPAGFENQEDSQAADQVIAQDPIPLALDDALHVVDHVKGAEDGGKSQHDIEEEPPVEPVFLGAFERRLDQESQGHNGRQVYRSLDHGRQGNEAGRVKLEKAQGNGQSGYDSCHDRHRKRLLLRGLNSFCRGFSLLHGFTSSRCGALPSPSSSLAS
jgi:hypothetical protein